MAEKSISTRIIMWLANIYAMNFTIESQSLTYNSIKRGFSDVTTQVKDEKAIDYFELHRDFYQREIDARDKIAARLNIPLALLVSIATYATYVAKTIDYQIEAPCWITISLILTGITSLVTFSFAAFHFVMALGGLKGHKYDFLPTSQEVHDYREQLKVLYADFPGEEQKQFDNYLFNTYCSLATSNAVVNDRRYYSLHRCTMFLVMTILPIVLFFMFFTFSPYNGEKKVESRNNSTVIVSPYCESFL